ncbi:MAG: B12-binding domain-containing radical SAM protein [Alphaproteobacteria bacterium]
MKPRILLVNPPIYDFSAYDFWLKPYGMLRAAGYLRGQAEFVLFDFLDRLDPSVPAGHYRSDSWGRGEFYSEPVMKPEILRQIPRRFRRFGLPRRTFHEFINDQGPFDVALVQTSMTYWYLGVREAIQELRRNSPQAKIILGGVYATLCASHARTLKADLIVEGAVLNPLRPFLGLTLDETQPPLWEPYPRLETGILKLADGCPFRCTYCSVPQVYPEFHSRPLDSLLRELDFLVERGVKNIAFYDDALLYRSGTLLKPFLIGVQQRRLKLNFHTPNALNARFVTRELADLMIASGFKNVYLGFESAAYDWQQKTGGKVYSDELAQAVNHLLAAGLEPHHLHAYIIIGHPKSDDQQVEDSIRFAHGLGIRVVLSEFSPIPGTPDGERCRQWADLAEPLSHNKTAFAVRRLGLLELNRLKQLAKNLNRQLGRSPVPTTQKIMPRELSSCPGV